MTTKKGARLKGGFGLEVTCACGTDLYGIDDEHYVTCPECGRRYTVRIELIGPDD